MGGGAIAGEQFLLEATLLSLAGGVAGVLGGATIALLVKNVLEFPAQHPVPFAGIRNRLGLDAIQ